MSFWDTEDGNVASKPVDTTFDEGGNIDPVPDGTVVTMAAKKAEWDDYEGDEYINIQWSVIDGPYKNKVIFHKLRILDLEAKKKARALRMLAVIDANASGRLIKLTEKPTDYDLMSICDHPMEGRLRIWEMNDKTGNWVEAVGALGSLSKKKPALETKVKEQFNSVVSQEVKDLDDDIPF